MILVQELKEDVKGLEQPEQNALGKPGVELPKDGGDVYSGVSVGV